MTSEFLKKYEVTRDFLEKYDVYAREFDVQERLRRRRRRKLARPTGRGMGTDKARAGAGTKPANRARGKKHGRIRAVFVIAAICLMTLLAGYVDAYGSLRSGSSGMSFSGQAAQAAEETVYKRIIVQSGDTLWGIAGEYSEPSKDIRKLVREICALNGIEPGGIYPGQAIIVPVPAHLA